MSLRHFCVTLSKNDTKYNRNPLSSKKHKGYIPLGKELFKQALNLIKIRIDEIQSKIEVVTKEVQNIPFKIYFEFNSDEVNYLKKIIKHKNFNLDETINIFNFKNSDCYNLYLKIINSNDYQDF